MLFFLFLSFGFMKCSTCDDCQPFAEEPYLKLRFYKATDSSASVVIIDSVNHIWAQNYTNFQDTVNTYLLPLNMNEDQSNFIITYRDTSDLNTYFTNTLNIIYERKLVKRTDNNIIVESLIKDTSSDFNLKNLQCKDESLNANCLSNEAIYQVYR